jgi:Tfp pilus assembly protein PilZ
MMSELREPTLDDASASDRRRYLRYAVRCPCWLESEQATLYAPTADVALGGVFLRTAVPLAEGDQVEVALDIGRRASAVRAQGVVTRSVRSRHGRGHGVGVEFVQILNGGERLLRFLGAGHPPVKPRRARRMTPSGRPEV